MFTKLPRDKKEVLATKVDWEGINEHGLTQRVIKPWVSKRIKEYLGVEEQAMISLVVSHVSSGKCTPESLLSKVGGILDDVAEEFVYKLWLVLLFEDQKVKQGIYTLEKQI